MPIIIGVLITLTAAVIIAQARMSGGVNAAKLGSVGEQWLAEYRASHAA